MQLEDQLVSELWARDVRFLMGDSSNAIPLLTPENLIQSLAESTDARLRLSLIPLFLRHPEFSVNAEKSGKTLSSTTPQIVLWFYYTAALLLQRKYQERLSKIFGLQSQLPDLFSKKINVDLTENYEYSLLELAKQHQILSGQSINWLGTYEHAANRLIQHMEKFK